MMTWIAARHWASTAAVFACAVMLSACGGSSGTNPAVTPVTSPPVNSSHATSLVHLNFVIPAKTASSDARSAQYVSTSTTSLTITVTPSGGTALAPVYVACTATCAATFQAPVGSDAVALKLTDGVNGSGNQLSLSTTTIAVVPNTANQFNLTANPVVGSVAVLLGSIPAATASANGGTAADVPVTVDAMDADGNTIVGPGNYVDVNGNPVTLSLSIVNAQAGGNGTVVLHGQTTFTAPSSATTTAHYDGNWLDHSTLSVASSSSMVTGLTGATFSTVPSVVQYTTGITAGAGLYEIIAGPDGNLWFAEYLGSRVGRITPSGSITEFSAGITGTGVSHLSVGSDGAIWFNEYNSGIIGRMTLGGSVTETAVGNDPTGMTLGPDGRIWYVEYGGNQVGAIATNFSNTSYSAGMPVGANPWHIVTGGDGNLWFTEYSGDQIGRITTAGAISNFSIGITAGAAPYQIAPGSDGNLWFTESAGNRVGRITASGVVTEFSSGLSGGASPAGITTGPDGNVWISEYNSCNVAKVTTAGVITEYTTGIGAGGGCDSMVLGPDGNLWFVEYNGEAVAKFIL